MRYLRQNTATRVTVGPFLDKTDGITPEVALTATNEHLTLMIDDAGVPTLVLDANATASAGNNDMVHVTNDDAGFYDLELTAAQTNYVGRAMLSINYVTDHCPVFHEFMIMPANVYDSMFGTDLLDINMAQILGTAVSTPATAGILDINLKNIANAAISTSTAQLGVNAVQAGAVAWASGAITAAAIADAAIDLATFAADCKTGSALKANVETVTAGAINAAAIATNAIDADALATDAVTEIQSGLATAAALTTVDDFVDTEIATIISELAKVPKSDSTVTWNATALSSIQSKAQDAITASALATAAELAKVPKSDGTSTWNSTALAAINAEVDTALNTAIPGSPTADSINERIKTLDDDWNNGGRLDLILDAASAPTAAQVADAVWDEVLHTAHEVAGSSSVLLQAAGGAADPLLNAVPGAYGAGTAGYVLGTNLAAIYGATERAAINLLDDSDGLKNIHDTVDTLLTESQSHPTLAEIEATTILAKAAALTLIAGYIDTEVATLVTEMAKVPKSDSNVTWNASALASINAEVDTALNTAIPGSPTADSINERVKAIDDLTQASGAGDLAAILIDTGTTLDTKINIIDDFIDTEVAAIKAKTDLIPAVPAATGDIPSAATIADAVWDETATGHTDAGKAGTQLWTDIDAVVVDVAGLDGAAMRGTDSAALASVCTETRLSELDAGTGGKMANQVDVIQTDTTTDIPALIDALPTAAEIKTAVEAAGGHLALILEDTGTTLDGKETAIQAVVDLIDNILRNKMEVTDANGNTVLYADDGTTPLFSVAACLTDNSTTTTRKRLA